MANINKFTSKESLNHGVSNDWNITVIDDASTPWHTGETSDETQHIDVTGYHRITFTFSSSASVHSDTIGFNFSVGAGEDIVLSSSTTHFEVYSGTYEIPIPTMINGVQINQGETVRWNVISSAENAVLRYMKQ